MYYSNGTFGVYSSGDIFGGDYNSFVTDSYGWCNSPHIEYYIYAYYVISNGGFRSNEANYDSYGNRRT